MFQDFVLSYLNLLRACYEELPLERLEKVMNVLAKAQAEGRKILIFGNGGSASTASHMACDLGKGTSVPNQRRVRVLALTDNIAAMSAWANDVGYHVIFEEQLANLLDPGDVVIGISASGNSPNVLRAVEYARRHAAITIGFAGFGGGKLKGMVDIDLTVSSRNYGQVEDLHLSLNHILSQYLKERIQAKSLAEQDSGSQLMRFFYTRPPRRGRRAGILLDRDGVINERIVGGCVTNWTEFRFVAGIQGVLARLSRLHLPMIVVSNQAGVGKRLVSPTALRDITDRFVTAIEKAGARIDAVYYCTHRPDEGCGCRKPKPGLLLRASRDWRLQLSSSVLIGDSYSDMEAARAVHCQGVLLDGGHAAPRDRLRPGRDEVTCADQVGGLPNQVAAALRRLPAEGRRAS